MVVGLLVTNDLPMSLVDNEYFRDMINFLRPNAANLLMKRTAFTAFSRSMTARAKICLKSLMQSELVLNINLTTDQWTLSNRKHYTCLMANILARIKGKIKVFDFAIEIFETSPDRAQQLNKLYEPYGVWHKTSFISTGKKNLDSEMVDELAAMPSSKNVAHARYIPHILHLISKEMYSHLVPKRTFAKNISEAEYAKYNNNYILETHPHVRTVLEKVKTVQQKICESKQLLHDFSMICSSIGHSRVALERFCQKKWTLTSFRLASAISVKDSLVKQFPEYLLQKEFNYLEPVVSFLSGIEHLTNMFFVTPPGPPAWLILGTFRILRGEMCTLLENGPDYFDANLSDALNAGLGKVDLYMDLLFGSNQDSEPTPLVFATFFHPYYRRTLAKRTFNESKLISQSSLTVLQKLRRPKSILSQP